MPWRVLALGLAIEAIFFAAVVGPFSLLVHGTELTDLGKLTDYQFSAAVLITMGLVALFVLYIAALLTISSVAAREQRPNVVARASAGGLTRRRGVSTIGRRVERKATPEARDLKLLFGTDRRHSALPSIVLGLTALFSLTLVFLYPVTAIDVFNYAVEGHIAVFHGVNPMVTPPSNVSSDPFVSFAGSWVDSTSPYGPIWIILTQLDALVTGSNVVLAILALKALAAVAVVATTYLLATAFLPRGPLASALAAMVFGWNPLVQLEMVGNGHNDAVMAFVLVAGLVLLTKKRPILAAAGVGVSVLIKFLTLGVVPLFLLAEILAPARSHRLRVARVAASTAVMIALAVVAYAPFWTGLATIERAQAVDSDYLSSIAALVILLVPDSINWLGIAKIAILAAVFLWQANSLRLGRANLAQAMFEVLFVTILIASHFAGWYLALLVAVAVLSGDRWIQARMVLFTFTTTLTTPLWAYLWYWNQDWMSMLTMHLIVVPLTFLPPLLVAVLAMARPRDGVPHRDRQPASYLDSLYVEIRNAYVSARSAAGSST